MPSEKLSDHTTATEQEPFEGSFSPVVAARKKKFGSDKYQPEFAAACFKLLSTSVTAKTKAHCCNFLQCTKPTLNLWMERYPEFGEAIRAGLQIGEAKWRQKIAACAFRPSSEVNNGLIKLLSANVYGIREEDPPPAPKIAEKTDLVGEAKEENRLDAAEVALENAIANQEPWAIKYLLSTKGRVRGYSEDEDDKSLTVPAPVKIEFSIVDGRVNSES